MASVTQWRNAAQPAISHSGRAGAVEAVALPLASPSSVTRAGAAGSRSSKSELT